MNFESYKYELLDKVQRNTKSTSGDSGDLQTSTQGKAQFATDWVKLLRATPTSSDSSRD
ncbi:hypothetical protein KIN20_033315 [Parelaphostrongylus tenuis]|uniref:Uncharacterized protein n=1 Tax=Parelaphostrongylus tenuis TaxID=148309 RepID=A0AAD5R889_PARTN|nr:hypothetical protein KIN20_033315 [Parelaphostrongylus tenuis]